MRVFLIVHHGICMVRFFSTVGLHNSQNVQVVQKSYVEISGKPENVTGILQPYSKPFPVFSASRLPAAPRRALSQTDGTLFCLMTPTGRYRSGKPLRPYDSIGQSCHSTPATNWKQFSYTKGNHSIGHQIEFCFFIRCNWCYIVMLEAC